MGRPAKTAFCPILFGANGGEFDSNGLPIFQRKRDLVIRGRCSEAYDCGTCPHLRRWVDYQMLQGWHVGWECATCIKQTRPMDEAAKIERRVPGFYQEGARVLALVGCTRCGWESIVLQLVLRR